MKSSQQRRGTTTNLKCSPSRATLAQSKLQWERRPLQLTKRTGVRCRAVWKQDQQPRQQKMPKIVQNMYMLEAQLDQERTSSPIAQPGLRDLPSALASKKLKASVISIRPCRITTPIGKLLFKVDPSNRTSPRRVSRESRVILRGVRLRRRTCSSQIQTS